MKLHFINFADARYRAHQSQAIAEAHASGQFDASIKAYTRDWLITTQFYADNKALLDEPRGCGYWLWKPFIILDSFTRMADGDALLYLDCGDIMEWQGLRDWFDRNLAGKDLLISWQPRYGRNHGIMTKRDCFVLMNCDAPLYHRSTQCEAGVITVCKTPKTIEFIQEWLRYCLDRRIVSDDANTCGLPNLPGFIDHRHDQSILTNLAVKHGIEFNGDMDDRIWFNRRKA